MLNASKASRAKQSEPDSGSNTHNTGQNLHISILFAKACLIRALPTQIMPPACLMGPSEHVLCIYIYIYIYILYKYITYLALKTMIVQNHIKHINTVGLVAAKAAANPIVCRGLI